MTRLNNRGPPAQTPAVSSPWQRRPDRKADHRADTDWRGAARPSVAGYTASEEPGAGGVMRAVKTATEPGLSRLPPSPLHEHPISARNRECGPVTDTDPMKRTGRSGSTATTHSPPQRP